MESKAQEGKSRGDQNLNLVLFDSKAHAAYHSDMSFPTERRNMFHP